MSLPAFVFEAMTFLVSLTVIAGLAHDRDTPNRLVAGSLIVWILIAEDSKWTLRRKPGLKTHLEMNMHEDYEVG